MLRRIIEISKEGLFLSTQRGCLVISEKSTELSKIPFSDIAVLLITAKGTTLTKNAMLEIIQHEGVLCFVATPSNQKLLWFLSVGTMSLVGV